MPSELARAAANARADIRGGGEWPTIYGPPTRSRSRTPPASSASLGNEKTGGRPHER